jgi:hypothetical protein
LEPALFKAAVPPRTALSFGDTAALDAQKPRFLGSKDTNMKRPKYAYLSCLCLYAYLSVIISADAGGAAFISSETLDVLLLSPASSNLDVLFRVGVCFLDAARACGLQIRFCSVSPRLSADRFRFNGDEIGCKGRK